MTEEQKNNPLHGIKLEFLMKELVDKYGWQQLAEEINLNCFKSNPSIKSSLKFLRRTEWAREKVERFYLYDFKRLPKASDAEYNTPPRKRVISDRSKARASEPRPQASRPRTREDHSESRADDKPAKKSSSAFNPWTAKKPSKD